MHNCRRCVYQTRALGTITRARIEMFQRPLLMQRSAYATNLSSSDGEGKVKDDEASSSIKAVTPNEALREMGSRSWSKSLRNIISVARSLIASLASWVWSCREILPQFYSPSPVQAIQRCFVVLAATLILCFIISGIDAGFTRISELFQADKRLPLALRV